MAQVNIHHFKPISAAENKRFSEQVQEAAALLVHDVKKADIKPDTVSIIVTSIDQTASMSGADTELQLFVSGNNWPKDEMGLPMNYAAAKKHFDNMAGKFLKILSKNQSRKIYVWVTPFVASGWAE